ncbi:ABC transporter permease [Methylobacterium nigriterrae]|uniref:ABC transporter permease n=1 Tax=Methylobacterium nigriterrae TaxID=3127512 RepID=UPI00301326B9
MSRSVSAAPLAPGPAAPTPPDPLIPDPLITDHLDHDRPEIIRERTGAQGGAVVEKPLSPFERLYNQAWLRKLLILAVLALIWEAYGRYLDNDLLFPTFSATVTAFARGVADGTLVARAWGSIRVLLVGYGLGIVLATVLTGLAMASRIGTDFLETMTSMLNPLPAIALLPLALIWFGLGNGSLVFVLVHSVTWAIALNTHSGFLSVSRTLKMVGRNYGLGGAGLIRKILIPAAFPSILTGLKVGWAFAWRTLIAAELVFGVSSGSGGLGWFIFENKNTLDIPNVFAGLLTVILIGLVVENLIFQTIERRTIQRWGMQA